MKLETIETPTGTYFVVDEINNYLYCANMANPEDLLIEKVAADDRTEIEPVTSESEKNRALLLYYNKTIKSVDFN